MMKLILENAGFILFDLGILIFLYFFLNTVRRMGKTSEKRYSLMQKVKQLEQKLDDLQSYP